MVNDLHYTGYDDKPLTDNLPSANKLLKVTDNVPAKSNSYYFSNNGNQDVSYVYDGNGNLIRDENKKVSKISYNYLNLPDTIQWNDGSRIEYVYAANGSKVLARYINSDGRMNNLHYYFSGVEYEAPDDESVPAITQFPFSEGRMVPAGTGFVPEYFMKDHLGNIRLSFQVSNEGDYALMQENYYYPFGLRVPLKIDAADNKYLYNGKELENFNQLNWYDYGGRFYDSQLGRWHSVDPNAYKYFSVSPYSYCFNSPIDCIDPDGKDIYVLFAKWGAHGFGHMAVIIGNETDGYTYYSKDGTSNWSQLFGPSIPDMKNASPGEFGSVSAFIRSINKGKEHPYTGELKIQTSKVQDDIMKQKALEQTKEFYDVISNSCQHTPIRALQSIGKYAGEYLSNINPPFSPQWINSAIPFDTWGFLTRYYSQNPSIGVDFSGITYKFPDPAP